MFERLAVAPAYRIVFQALEREILSQRLEIGQLLPTETELARQFGVTRHTVREGIRMLEETGMVRREAGRRLYVAKPLATASASRSSRALVMHRVTFRELLEVAVDMETAAAERAAERMTPEILDQLKDNLRATQAALASGASVIPLDVQFHELIAEATGNKALLVAREPISALFHPALDNLFSHPVGGPVGPPRLLEAHRKIVEGFENRDPQEVRAWMHRHMIDFRRGYALCGLDMDAAVQHPSA